MWAATILETVSSVVDHLSNSYYFANTVVTQALFGFMDFGIGGFLSTVVQFGIDQLHDASTDKISAYIMWYVWTCTFPLFLMKGYNYLQLNHQHFVLLGNLFVYINVSLILVSLFCWNNLLIKEPISQNPFVFIYKVSKYAVKYRYLTSRRSAFTYAEQEPIGRIDLGKSKYEGPFTTEEVEDVKTFYRLLPLIMGGGLIANGLLAASDLDVYLEQQYVIPLTKSHYITNINQYVAANIIPSC